MVYSSRNGDCYNGAVFVIDRHDHIVYAEYVADQMREPDYSAPMHAIRQALAT